MLSPHPASLYKQKVKAQMKKELEGDPIRAILHAPCLQFFIPRAVVVVLLLFLSLQKH